MRAQDQKKNKDWQVAALVFALLALAALLGTLEQTLIGFKLIPQGAKQPQLLIWVFDALRWFGGILGAFALANIALGWSQTITYLEERLSAVIKSDKPFFSDLINEVLERRIEDPGFLATLTRPALDELHRHVIAAIGEGKLNHEGGFYKLMCSTVEPLLFKPHMDLLKVTLQYDFYQKNGVAYVRSTRSWTQKYHSWKAEEVTLGIAKRLRPVPGIKNEDLFRLDAYTVDGDDRADLLKGPQVVDNIVVWEMPEFRESIEAGGHLETYRDETVIVPIDDELYWRVQPGRSVRQVVVDVTCNLPVRPTVTIYGFQDENRTPTIKKENPKKYQIEWHGWMLPYHCVVLQWQTPHIADIPTDPQ